MSRCPFGIPDGSARSARAGNIGVLEVALEEQARVEAELNLPRRNSAWWRVGSE